MTHRPGDMRQVLGPLLDGHGRTWLPADPLADDIAAVLADAPTGLSCDTIREHVCRRRTDVLAVLRSDRRFVATGSTHGRRWRLVSNQHRGGSRDGIGRTDEPNLDSGRPGAGDGPQEASEIAAA